MMSHFPQVRTFKVRGNYPNRRSLVRSYRKRIALKPTPEPQPVGYSPSIAEVFLADDPEPREVALRDTDLPLLCLSAPEAARRHCGLILAARAGLPEAIAALDRAVESHYQKQGARLLETVAESREVVPSTSTEPHTEAAVSDKGKMLLELSRRGYPVPDFVILTAEASIEWERRSDEILGSALRTLELLTGRRMGDPGDPLVIAIRTAMPQYIPGFMPTYLNCGVTEPLLSGLRELYGAPIANKIFLNTLRNLLLCLEPRHPALISSSQPQLGGAEVATLLDGIAKIVRGHDRRLLEDPSYQIAFFLNAARRYFQANADLLLTIARGTQHYPSAILQMMVCSVRDDASYAGVLYSRHSWTGVGHQLQIGHNIFGEDIMTGTVEPEEVAFTDPQELTATLPAVSQFIPHLGELEREFASPVAIEFAAESIRGHQFFALLQLNAMEMSGRAAIVSVVDLHERGVISRKRVTELICPFHIKQIEADAIDLGSLDTLQEFSHGVAILPRGEVSCRVYFSAEAALRAKKTGLPVCLCQKTFLPTDTVSMREMDAIVSLTAAAIHVVTICQSFGVPALLSLERFGVSLRPDGQLANAEGLSIREGEWVTISSFKRALYRGEARFRPARLVRMMRGERVDLAENERHAFAQMAHAYRSYQQLVRCLELDQISSLNELIRLVNLELRGQAEQARALVQAWFDAHQAAYLEGVLASDMGDHLNQHTVFDMLSLDRKTRFFKTALERCWREKRQGYSAGAFMLGRFVSSPQPIAFWRSFEPLQLALLLNEWVLFEKYLQVLNLVGERKIVRAKSAILKDGLGEMSLDEHTVKGLIPLKLSGASLDSVAAALPPWCDPQVLRLLEVLKHPYHDFYDYQAPWSINSLRQLCETEGVAVPGPDES